MQSVQSVQSVQSLPGQHRQQPQQGFPAQAEGMQRSVVQHPVTPALPISQPGFQEPAPASITAEPSQAQTSGHTSKLRVVIVIILFLVLLAGGLLTWAVEYDPFSVPAVTNTTLSFQNKDLGIALHYPQGWNTQLDKGKQEVSFFDANHTDQLNVLVTPTSGQSIDQYLKQETSQLGLTAQKNLTPLTFAAADWQRVQGTVLVSGATYTETLLVATHEDQFYALVQMAPASTYTDADDLFFSKIRASFQIL
jgi:uncharacterized membrane protein YgcG